MAVARAPPQMSLEEENIIVYIAGYLVKKAGKKFGCEDCCKILSSNSSNHNEASTFINNKQYTNLSEGGLLIPSDAVIHFTTILENEFRSHLQYSLYSKGIRKTFVSHCMDTLQINNMSCDSASCKTVTAFYMINLFFVIRIHHFLRVANQSLSQSGQKRNRKILKLTHT